MLDWIVVYFNVDYLSYERCSNEGEVKEFIEDNMDESDMEKIYVIHGSDVYNVNQIVELVLDKVS
jgi:hypothetical protein